MLNEDSRWWGRPPEVWTLAIVDLLGGAILLIGAIRPTVEETPAGLLAFGAALAFTLAVALFVAGARTPTWARHLNLVAVLSFTALLVSQAAVPEGAASTCFAFVIVGLYAALFLPRHEARCYVAASVVTMWFGLQANDVVVHANRSWMPVAVAVIGSTEVLAALHSRVLALTVTDSLTGALNRTGFARAVEQERLIAGRNGEPLALVVIDLDRFKDVNDRHGHAVGDDLLCELAAEWRSGLRPRDVLARRGGDEFALLLPATSTAVATTIADRLQRTSSATWSYGVALVDDDLDAALLQADRAMYAQKATRERPPSSVV